MFTYPTRALAADYAGASVGLPFVGCVLFLPMHWAFQILFGAIALLLLGVGLRTFLRQFSRVELTETGIALIGPLPRQIAWAELAQFRLRYFAVRKDRKRGWMELTLTAGRTKLSIESQIDGFETIVERAAHAAAGLEVDEGSLINLGTLGIAIPTQPGEGR